MRQTIVNLMGVQHRRWEKTALIITYDEHMAARPRRDCVHRAERLPPKNGVPNSADIDKVDGLRRDTTVFAPLSLRLTVAVFDGP